MILFDQIISAVLWFGLALAVGGLEAALAYAERVQVWYKWGGKVSSRDEEVARNTFFGSLRHRLLLPTTWAIVIGVVAYAAIGYAAWYPWAFFDATHTSTLGILGYSFTLGTLLLLALYAPIFYWGKTPFGAFLVVLLQMLLTAATAVMLALQTWLVGEVVIDDVSAFIVACVPFVYFTYQTIYLWFVYTDSNKKAHKYSTANSGIDRM